MLNNDERVFKSGKTYIAGKDFNEGLIELKPLVTHTSGIYYKAEDFEAKHTYQQGGVFDTPAYVPLTKGSKLELYVDVLLNTYTREDHMVFSPGFYEAGEDFRAGLVRILNRMNMVSITIHDGDTLEKIDGMVSSGDPAEIYLTIEKGQMLMIYNEGTELIEYRKI